MLNTKNLFHSYSLSIINIIDLNNKFILNSWIKFFKILEFILKIKNFENYLFDNKLFIFNEIIILFEKNFLLDKNMKSFLYILIKDNLLKYIKLIHKYFIKIYEFKKNIINVFIYFRNLINKKNLFLIKNFIKNRFNKNLKFYLIKKKNIISGFKININDFVIDNSLLNILKKIKLLNYKECKNVF